jgi:hypothetical protein
MVIEEREKPTQLLLFEDNLPHRPYCTDSKEFGLQIRPKAIAMGKKIIQPNTVAKVLWLVFDYDKTDVLGKIEEKNLPYPNLLVTNPENGKAHIYYSLVSPVCKTDNARRKPLEYLAKIQFSFGQKLGSDIGYSGLVAKNPLHSYWKVEQFSSKSYELGELAEYLDLPLKLPKRASTEGLGRNCSIFETVRHIAYANVLKFKIEQNSTMWDEFILNECKKINAEFLDCLEFKEVAGIAKSISRWTWRKYNKHWSDEKFSEIQAKRGRVGGLKSGTTRTIKTEKKRLLARSMRSEGQTLKEISALLEVPLSTIGRWCK